MGNRKFLDLRSVAFGMVGCLVALFALWLDREWHWWLLILGALGVVFAARLRFGQSVRALAFGVGALVGALATVVALYSFLFGYPTFDNWWHQAEFDAAAWRQNDKGDNYMWPPRLRMVDNLLSTRDLHGWDRKRVVALLGEPDESRWDAERQLVYLLGPERGLFRIDRELLVISFDTEGKVSSYRLRTD